MAVCSKNHKSALDNSNIVRQKIKEEVDAGRVAGPFKEKPFPNLWVSPVGIVPKSEAGKFRLIFDLSHPPGRSVNDGIPPTNSSVKYTQFDDAVKMVHQLGQGAEMIKADIKSAFRLIPINPADFMLLGMQFDNLYYIDKALPFGSSSSCLIFEKFSTFLNWCVCAAATSNNLLHYLDDFFWGWIS